MKWQITTPLLGFLCFWGIQPSLAHGAKVTYQTTSTVEVQAAYDSGTPMANAQVNVYTPTDPMTPWKTGVTNEQGIFRFVPDGNQTGYWEVQVRQAGHGGIVSIPIESEIEPGIEPGIESGTEALSGSALAVVPEGSSPSSSSNSTIGSYSPLQKGIMIGSVIWGLVGTALFFSRRRFESTPATPQASPSSNSAQSDAGSLS